MPGQLEERQKRIREIRNVAIIAHGSSSALAIRNAIRVACESVSHEVNPHIEEALRKLG